MGTKEIKKVFHFLEENQKHFTDSQFEFIKSLRKYFRWKKSLSEKQIACLVSMKENILTPAQ